MSIIRRIHHKIGTKSPGGERNMEKNNCQKREKQDKKGKKNDQPETRL